MKCEIKYIENNIKKDLKRLTIKGILATIIISGSLGLIFSFIFNQKVVYVLLMTILLIVFIVVWTDAVQYCKNLKKNDNKIALS